MNIPPTDTKKYLLHIVSKHKMLASGVLLMFTVWDLILVAYPIIIQQTVDRMITTTSASEQVELLGYGITAFLGLMVFLYFFARTSTIFLTRLSSMLVVTAAREQMQYVIHHSHSYFSNRLSGSVNGKISSASDGLQQFVTQVFFDGYSRFINVVGVIVITGFVDWRFAVLLIMCVLVVSLVDIKMVRKRRGINKAYSASNVLYRGKSVDVVGNAATVRQFSQSEIELGRLSEYIEDRRSKLIKQVVAAQQVVMTNNVIVWIVNALALGIVYWLFQQGQITIGQIVLVITLLTTMNRNINGLGNLISNLGRQYVDIQNGLEDIFIPHEIVDMPNAAEIKIKDGNVQFVDATFSYERETVFEELNLTIEPGQRVGLVGPSGAGKSTLVSLLLRQHDIDSGAILIDNQNIAEVTQDSLRQNIALVPQEPMLFHRTIRENIMYGKPDATQEEMVQSAQRAQAREFIEALPQGYDTLVGERGVKLSGGQKQRVAIARAMLKEAPVLVLDEATSALDSESEVAIQKALEELMEGKTVIAVAHRLSTLRKMDRILVIDNGVIVEDGTHDTLADAGGMYAKLWEHQAGGFIK